MYLAQVTVLGSNLAACELALVFRQGHSFIVHWCPPSRSDVLDVELMNHGALAMATDGAAPVVHVLLAPALDDARRVKDVAAAKAVSSVCGLIVAELHGKGRMASTDERERQT